MAEEHEKRRLIQRLRAEMVQATGRRYEGLDLDAMDAGSLRELARLLRDLDGERRADAERARMNPWRTP